MKKHFGKQVIERPRRGSSTARSAKAASYGRITRDSDGYDYEGFTRLPVSRKQQGFHKTLGDKAFTDVLGPIKSFLRRRCGQPWDDVWSEIKTTLGKSTWSIQHIVRDHINVAINTWRGVDDVVYTNSRYGVKSIDSFYFHFYVEPETGLLRKVPGAEKKFRYRTEPVTDVIPIAEGKEYRNVNGIWFYHEYVTASVREPHFLRGAFIGHSERITMKVHKRQLNKKELRDLGLR